MSATNTKSDTAQSHDHSSHDNHGHHPSLAHHFVSLEQQHEANILGMWMFLVTEVLFFGGLFTAYTVYRLKFNTMFHGLLDRGVYIAPALYEAGFVSGAHTAQDIADTVSAARDIFKAL